MIISQIYVIGIVFDPIRLILTTYYSSISAFGEVDAKFTTIKNSSTFSWFHVGSE